MFLFNRGSVIILLAAVVLYGLMFAYPGWGAWYDAHGNTILLLFAGIGVVGWSFWRRSRQGRRREGAVNRDKREAEGPATDTERYKGMTLNERLYTAGLLDRFDAATEAGDRTTMAELLAQVGVEGDRAKFTIDTLLANPGRYRRYR